MIIYFQSTLVVHCKFRDRAVGLVIFIVRILSCGLMPRSQKKKDEPCRSKSMPTLSSLDRGYRKTHKEAPKWSFRQNTSFGAQIRLY